MLPPLRSHEEYIKFVWENMKNVSVPEAHKDVVDKLKLLDLTPIRLLFLPLYCLFFGRIGFSPEDLIRCFIAMVLCGITSPTDWVCDYLKDKSGFYAIISGFSPSDIPSVGCLYDFMRRILNIPYFCKKNHIRQKKKRLTKSEKEQLKEDKKKVTKRHVKIVAKLSLRFSRIVEKKEKIFVPDAEKMVNDIIKLCCISECISESQKRKLINNKNLNIAGDGSKISTHSKRYGKKICKCSSCNCDCFRFYNDKDASIGYDSYHDTFIFGYNFYQISSFSFSNNFELPIYLMMATGKRHDAPLGMFAMHRVTQVMGYKVSNACFDAAHDATEFYMLAQEYWNTNFFIPLNTTNAGNLTNLPMAYINSEGIPHCQAGHEMIYYGYCKDRDRIKFRCPIRASKKGKSLICDFIDYCSPSSYGRVVYTHPKDNPRLYPTIPRNSQKWQDIYDKRTSVERVFKREKNDFKLASFKTRCKERYLFYALLTAIAIHVDAWLRQDREKKRKQTA